MAKLTTGARNLLASPQFALPGSRRFPIPDKAHAANAKARATQGVQAGTLAPATAAKIKAKANKKLTGVTQDINLPGMGEDLNVWKSKPVTTRSKWMNNSQGTGAASQTGDGKSFKDQPKHGGTQVADASKKGQAKISPNSTQAPVAVAKKGQSKFGGTASGNGGTRYANGSSSHDSMKSMIRTH